MQEEVENRTVNLAISTTKLTGRTILGISRTSAYNLVKKKVFHSVRIGGSIRISKKSFDEWLDHQM